MEPDDPIADDETRISEITILPDGRIYVFGMSRQVLEMLGELRLADPGLRQRIEQVRRCSASNASSTRGREEGSCDTRSADAHRLRLGESKR